MTIKVEPVQATYIAIQKRLEDMEKGSSVREVMLRAINETASVAQTRLYEDTRSTYEIKARQFKKSDIKLKKASARTLEATLKLVGEPIGVRKGYKTRKNSKRKGASVKVAKSSAMEELKLKSGGRIYKAFLATMGSGHTGVFQRVPGKRMKYKRKEAIKEIMSLSKAKAAEVASKKYISDEINEELAYRMLKNMNAVIGV